jgi:hypothetical protein
MDADRRVGPNDGTEALRAASVTDSPDGPYPPLADTWLTRNDPLDLTGKEGCDVHYWLRLETELNADAIWLETSTDGTPWTVAGGWTGTTQGQFVAVEDSLFKVDGEPNVRFRYRLQSNAANQFDGAYIDDVVVTCLSYARRAMCRSPGPRWRRRMLRASPPCSWRNLRRARPHS